MNKSSSKKFTQTYILESLNDFLPIVSRWSGKTQKLIKNGFYTLLTAGSALIAEDALAITTSHINTTQDTSKTELSYDFENWKNYKVITVKGEGRDGFIKGVRDYYLKQFEDLGMNLSNDFIFEIADSIASYNIHIDPKDGVFVTNIDLIRKGKKLRVKLPNIIFTEKSLEQRTIYGEDGEKTSVFELGKEEAYADSLVQNYIVNIDSILGLRAEEQLKLVMEGFKDPQEAMTVCNHLLEYSQLLEIKINEAKGELGKTTIQSKIDRLNQIISEGDIIVPYLIEEADKIQKGIVNGDYYKGILADTTSITQPDLIQNLEQILSPIKAFETNDRKTNDNFFNQVEYISELTEFITELYKHAGSDTTLIDDNTRKLEKAIKGFNETYGILSQGEVFNGVADNLDEILKNREDFSNKYNTFISKVETTLKQRMTEEEWNGIIAPYKLVAEKLEKFNKTELDTMNFETYYVEFDIFSCKKDTLKSETTEIKNFKSKYLHSLKTSREKLAETRMGEEIINNQNANLENLADFYKDKLGTLQDAYNLVGIRHRNLVNKQMIAIDNMLEEISEITGTEYGKVTAKPKLKHPKPVSLKHNKPVREGLSFGGFEAGLLYNPKNNTLNPSVPLFGLRENFGSSTFALGGGYSKTSGSRKQEEFTQADPVTGIRGHNVYESTDWGHKWVAYADLSFPIIKELNFNLGVLGISKDSNPRGTVTQNIVLPNGDEVLGSVYPLNLPTTSSTEFYGTAGLKQNIKNFDLKAKVAFAKGKKPSYMATVGYTPKK